MLTFTLAATHARSSLCPLTLSILAFAACSPEGGSQPWPTAHDADASPAAPTAASQAAAQPASTSDPDRISAPNGAVPGDFVAGEGAATSSGAAALDGSCAATTVQAEKLEAVIEVPVEEEVVVPSVFYLMLDSSGSMDVEAPELQSILEQIRRGLPPTVLTKWEFAVASLKSFLADPASVGIELALGFFPGAGLCDGQGYDVPTAPLGVLPDNARRLSAALDARQPNGGTPLEGALRGATGFCLAYNAANPNASCVAVLITDGAAEDCDARSAAQLASIAADAAQRDVITFAAGMQGADFAVLDAIGQAGGGDCDPSTPGFACDLTADSDAFAAALKGIRDRTRTQTRIETRIEEQRTVLPCEWEIPAAPAGEIFDRARVNVQLTTPGVPAIAVANVPNAAACGDVGGWYYDDPAAPSSVAACPNTCDLLRALPDSRVDLLLGCVTQLR